MIWIFGSSWLFRLGLIGCTNVLLFWFWRDLDIAFAFGLVFASATDLLLFVISVCLLLFCGLNWWLFGFRCCFFELCCDLVVMLTVLLCLLFA